MALSLRKKSPSGIVGLDIDGSYLAAAQVANGRVSRAASAELPPGVMSAGEVSDEQALSESIRELFSVSSLPRSVYLGISNQHIAMRLLDMPHISNSRELDSGVRFVAQDVIPMPLEDAVLDYHVLGASSSGAPGTDRVVLVAARRAMVASFLAAARAAGLNPLGVDLDAFALIRMLGNDPDAEDVTRVYCHLAGVTNFAVARGSACLFTRPLAVGPAESDAEHAHVLAHEIQLSINSYMAQPDAHPVDDVMLSGPGARVPTLPETVGERINLPVSVAAPLGRMDESFLPDEEDPYRHTVSAGLALGAAA
jgi:type IV pilus assembly protein PilM